MPSMQVSFKIRNQTQVKISRRTTRLSVKFEETFAARFLERAMETSGPLCGYIGTIVSLNARLLSLDNKGCEVLTDGHSVS